MAKAGGRFLAALGGIIAAALAANRSARKDPRGLIPGFGCAGGGIGSKFRCNFFTRNVIAVMRRLGDYL